MAMRDLTPVPPAIVAAERAGIAFTVHEYAHDPNAASYGLEAAEKLGIDPARVFKSLVADVDGVLTVAIVPVETELDLKALGKRVTMADPKLAERTTGYGRSVSGLALQHFAVGLISWARWSRRTRPVSRPRSTVSQHWLLAAAERVPARVFVGLDREPWLARATIRSSSSRSHDRMWQCET